MPIYFLSSCKEKFSPFTKDNIAITTFNLNWLGDGYNDRIDRTDEDYYNIASIIEDLDSDIFCLQEIENDRAIQKIISNLPDYKYIISKNGNAQKLAIIYKNYLQVKNQKEISELMLSSSNYRPGLSVNVKYQNFDFELINIHLKSTSSYDSTDAQIAKSQMIRSNQISVLNNWVNIFLDTNREEDIIIVGDFNDTPHRKINNTLSELLNNKNISFITADLKSCGKYKNSYVIDNIAISLPVMNRLIPKSLSKYDIYTAYSAKEAKSISDHCPITARFDCYMPDND